MKQPHVSVSLGVDLKHNPLVLYSSLHLLLHKGISEQGPIGFSRIVASTCSEFSY